MKNLRHLLLLLALMGGGTAWAGVVTSGVGQITATAATCTAGVCVSLRLSGHSSANITVTGTFSATLTFEASPDGGNTWVAINGTPPSSTTAVTTTTATGVWVFNVSAMTDIRARGSAYASGTAVVTILASTAVSTTGSGAGGGGTVTSVTGTANQITSTGGATPVLSLPSVITLPGTINKLTLTAPATAATLTVPDGTTATGPTITSNLVGTLSAQVGNTDTVACPNNTTGNFATTYTIPANYLVANKVLRLTISFGITSSASPPNVGYRMTIGGTTVFSGTAVVPTINMTGSPITAQFYIQGSAAAGASAAVYTAVAPGFQISGTAYGPWVSVGAGVNNQPVNLATNGTMVIQPQLFCSANTAGNSLTLQQFILEALN